MRKNNALLITLILLVSGSCLPSQGGKIEYVKRKKAGAAGAIGTKPDCGKVVSQHSESEHTAGSGTYHDEAHPPHPTATPTSSSATPGSLPSPTPQVTGSPKPDCTPHPHL